MPKGYFTFVLHSHMPYVRQAGRWPHGEEMLHETIAETYLPLLNALYDLRAEGVPFRLTVGITPILAEQLADADVLDHFETFLLEEMERAERDVERFEKEEKDSPTAESSHLLYLARFYVDWHRSVLESFRERFKRDLIAARRSSGVACAAETRMPRPPALETAATSSAKDSPPRYQGARG